MLECISDWLSTQLPEGFHILDTVPTLGFLILTVVVLAVINQAIDKNEGKYNHALSSAMAILFAYVFLMMVHNENPPEFISDALNTLPLIEYKDGAVTLFQFDFEHLLPCCKEVLQVFILSAILIGLDDMIPDSRNGLTWIILQSVIVAISLFIYWGVIKAIHVFMPGILNSYAPLVLVGILFFMVGMAVLRLILGLLLTAVNPFIGAFSTFFGTSPVGKALGKAALCTVILTVVSYFLAASGLTTITLVSLTWLVCFLPLGVLLLLWFIVGYIIK